MCKVVEENPMDLVQASLAGEPAEVNAVKKLAPLETISENINRTLTPTVPETPILNSDNRSKAPPQNDCKLDSSAADDKPQDMVIECDPIKESCSSLLNEKKVSNTEMDESHAELNENSDAGVIVLDE